MIEILIAYAMTFMGIPYKWGGSDRVLGYDCSGFVQECLSSIGEDSPGDQNAQAYFNTFVGDHPSCEEPKRGDLLFFGSETAKVSHIAIALSSELMIECAGGNSTTLTLQQAVARNAMVRIRPIFSRKDFLLSVTFL